MDQEPQSASWQPIDRTAFYGKCKSVDEWFIKNGLTRIELDVPETGLFAAGVVYPIAQVTRQSHEHEDLVKPMKYVMSFDSKNGLKRSLELTLTKPMQFGCGQRKGFSYDVAPRKEVVISRLVVNLADLETAINSLVAEGNRYYFLYCYPY